MNQHLERILSLIQQQEGLTEINKSEIVKALKDADKVIEITAFKLDRTEKVKRTTAILLEETIEELEQKRNAVEESNTALTQSIEELKAAQAQLIQSEKMASLGELTAGIAHEIQNPLNFVNNFSEVNIELLEEVRAEIVLLNKHDLASQRDVAKTLETVSDFLDDIKENEVKILHHGKRADAIVKGMLLHSRSSSGEKEPTDINALTDEYLRLSYHGLRAKNKSFNAEFRTDLDPTLPPLHVIPQDIGRVLLNLINNAFQACGGQTEKPLVMVTTRLKGDKAEITVTDNGPGIPDAIKDKIFQPFFTTKPTGQGTGLGLSLSYDIVTAHGGELRVETRVGEGAAFLITLPIQYA